MDFNSIFTNHAVKDEDVERGNRTNKVLVSLIPSHVDEKNLLRILNTFDDVQHLEVNPNGKNDQYYSVVVTYETPDQAQQSFTQLNGHDLEGSAIKIDFVMDENHRGYRGGRGGGPGNSRQSNSSYTGAPPSSTRRPNDLPLRILVLSDMVRAIIGRGGVTVKQINQLSSARVYVHGNENAGSVEQVITIQGQPDTCSMACQKILQVLQLEAKNTNRGEIPLKILAHDNLVGRIIGKHGNVKKRIMELTDTIITVSRNMHDVNSVNLEKIVTIQGTSDNICKAEQLISSKLRQSYERDLVAMTPQPLVFSDLHPMTMMSTLRTHSYSSGVPRGAPYNMHNNSSARSYLPTMYSHQQNQQGNGISGIRALISRNLNSQRRSGSKGPRTYPYSRPDRPLNS